MTTDTLGGVFNHALQLCSGLRRHGVEVVLATMGGHLTPVQRGALRRTSGLTVFESPFRVEWMDDAWSEVDRAGHWLLGIADRIRPDLVHLNGYAHAALPWDAPCVVAAHSCAISWWTAVRRRVLPARYGEYWWRVARGLGRAAMVIAPSQAMLRVLADTYGPLRRSRVIHPARSSYEFPIECKMPFILSVGSARDEAKNLTKLNAAAADVAWPVAVAGAAPGINGPARKLAHLKMLGPLRAATVRSLLARASIYAHPARYEPFGFAALEAAAAGCALVLGDIPSLREIWQDAAVFVAPDGADAIARELSALMGDPRRRVALGAKARELALQYTPERMVDEYLRAYGEVLISQAAHVERLLVVPPVPTRERASALTGMRA